jgi:hypothetical protein
LNFLACGADTGADEEPGERMLERLAELANGDEDLVWKGRGLTATMLIGVGDEEWLVDVDAGRVARVRKGPFRMASWTFALKGTREGWGKFWQPVPPPYYQDIFGLLRQGELRFEGDLLPLWRSMMYVKGLLATLRGNGAPA